MAWDNDRLVTVFSCLQCFVAVFSMFYCAFLSCGGGRVGNEEKFVNIILSCQGVERWGSAFSPRDIRYFLFSGRVGMLWNRLPREVLEVSQHKARTPRASAEARAGRGRRGS